MSFIKIQKIDPNTITPPDNGNVYLGQDDFGLWQMDDTGLWWYVQSGFTVNSSSSGTSGINGTSGSSGKDGSFLGSSGTSGKTGFSGTVGTSGSSGNSSAGTSGLSGSTGTSGTSGWGTSGINGSSGINGNNGTNGSSGIDGSSGTSGSSGVSGIDGGYGAATRKWILNLSNTVPLSGDTFISATSDRLDMLNYIRLNKIDSDSSLLTGWIDSWNNGGILKIEDRKNLSVFGIYSIPSGSTTKIGNFYHISSFTILSALGVLLDQSELLISFVYSTIGVSGTYNFDGSTLGTVSSMVILNGIITSIILR